MAVNVDTVYQRVLAIANKEQRGYITPQEFNLLANQAQMDIFEQYFYDINQFERVPGNDTEYSNMSHILKEIISPFEQDIMVYEIEETIHNKEGGDSVTVPGFAAAVYDVIMGSEMVLDWDKVQKGCSWFAKEFPKAYMALLD